MKEYKPFKSGKVRELYDLGDSLIRFALTAFPHSIIFWKIRFPKKVKC